MATFCPICHSSTGHVQEEHNGDYEAQLMELQGVVIAFIALLLDALSNPTTKDRATEHELTTVKEFINRYGDQRV